MPEYVASPASDARRVFEGRKKACTNCGRVFVTTPSRRLLCADCFARADSDNGSTVYGPARDPQTLSCTLMIPHRSSQPWNPLTIR